MKCRKAFEIDLADFVVDPEAAEWAAFRVHYPTCRDCSAELEIWDEMRAALRSGGRADDETHPPKDVLLRYEEQPQTLPAAERARVEQHLAGCRSCPDELLALRRFDFTALQRRTLDVASMTHAPQPRPFTGLRRIVWHPAFAYAALLAVVLYSIVIRPQLASRPLPSAEIARPLEVREERLAERGQPDAMAPAIPPPPTAMHAEEEPRLAAAKPLRGQKNHDRAAAPVTAEAVPPSEPPGVAERPAPHATPALVADDLEMLADEDGSDDGADHPRTLGLAESEAPERDRWHSIALAPGRTPEVKLADVATGIVLRLPSMREAVEVRVAGPEARPATPGPLRFGADEPIAIRMKVGELLAGTYRVTMQSQGDGVAPPIGELFFVVR